MYIITLLISEDTGQRILFPQTVVKFAILTFTHGNPHSMSDKCNQCQKSTLKWITSRLEFPIDVLTCSDCGHRQLMEDWTPPLSPLYDNSCANCSAERKGQLCPSCGLSEEEDLQVHQELRALVFDGEDFLAAARAANRIGRRLLALKLATIAVSTEVPHRSEAARALRIWLLSAVGEPKAAYEDALTWVKISEEPTSLAWGSFGQQCEHQDKLADAAEAYEQALAIDPAQHIIRVRRATILLDQKREGQALQELLHTLAATQEESAMIGARAVAERLCESMDKRANHDGIMELLHALGSQIDHSAPLLAYAAYCTALAGNGRDAKALFKKAQRIEAHLEIYERVQQKIKPLQTGWRPW